MSYVSASAALSLSARAIAARCLKAADDIDAMAAEGAETDSTTGGSGQ